MASTTCCTWVNTFREAEMQVQKITKKATWLKMTPCYTQKILKMLPENYSSSSMNSAKLQETKLIQQISCIPTTLTTKDRKEKLRGKSHLPLHQKKIPRNKKLKEEKDLYSENCKTLMKEIKQKT